MTIEFRQDNSRVKVAFRYVTPILPKGDQMEGRGRGARVRAKVSLSFMFNVFRVEQRTSGVASLGPKGTYLAEVWDDAALCCGFR